jgi:hypothetical protein
MTARKSAKPSITLILPRQRISRTRLRRRLDRRTAIGSTGARSRGTIPITTAEVAQPDIVPLAYTGHARLAGPRRSACRRRAVPVTAGKAAEGRVSIVFAGERVSLDAVGRRWWDLAAAGGACARRRTEAVVAGEAAEAEVVAWTGAGRADACRG